MFACCCCCAAPALCKRKSSGRCCSLLCADGAGEDDLEEAAWLGEASLAARAREEDWREGGSLEGVLEAREEEGRPGASANARLAEVGVGGCWGEEANCLGGAIVAGGGVDGVVVAAVVATGGVHTPPGAGEDMLEAAEAKGEKAPKGKSACSLGSGENG